LPTPLKGYQVYEFENVFRTASLSGINSELVGGFVFAQPDA